MTDFNQNVDQAKDLLNLEQKDMAKLPSMLNVLTILTYVGCGLGAIKYVWDYFAISASYKLVEAYNTGTKTNTGNSFVDNALASGMEMAKKQYDNRLMILLLSLIGVGLCFYGAMQMRNLKKQGYLIYVIGEIIPIISFTVFVGFGSIFSALAMVFVIIFAALFIILYTTQRKFLVN
jgi:hypothetical protein